jgi:hypothetical protein
MKPEGMEPKVHELLKIDIMNVRKKIFLFATAAFLFSGVAFAGNVRKMDPVKNIIHFPERSNIYPSDNEPTVRSGDKGKEKGKKKEKTHKTCPGKECKKG